MGGSGVAGEILQAVGKDQLRLPVVLVGDYSLPAFVGPSTLVFAVSFSGETEETLEATEAALRPWRQAHSGDGWREPGRAGRRGRGAGVRDLAGDPTTTSRGGDHGGAPSRRAGTPRAARRGSPRPSAQRSTSCKRRRDSLVGGGGTALEIAQRLDRTIPLVQGASGIGAVAARRWKTQLNENAKAPAFFATQPEWCHNEICGFGQNGDVTRQVMTIVTLRSDFEHPQVERRFSLVEEFVGEAVASVIEVRADGSGPLAQLFDLIMIGDFVSLHVASREGIDPGPIPVLVEVKRRLAASRQQASG